MASKQAQTSDAAQNSRTDPNLSGSQATLGVSRITVDSRTGLPVSAGTEGNCTSNQLYPGSPIPKHAD
jgi:hypothetical protein